MTHCFYYSSADGVHVQYQVSNEVATGTCAVLVTGTHRSLCANLGAAQHFTPDHLQKEECKKSIEAAKFFYASVSYCCDFLVFQLFILIVIVMNQLTTHFMLIVNMTALTFNSP